MANKKLKVEVELETQKAKQQLGRIGDGMEHSGSVPSTRSMDKLSEATRLNTHQLLSMTRAFSGLAVGLAASYSASYFEKGSLGDRIMGYGGSIVGGASMGAMAGSMAGPIGMAAGAVIGGASGGVKEYLDRGKAQKTAREEYERFENTLLQNQDFSDFMKRMTSPFNYDSIGVKLGEMSDYYDRLQRIIEILVQEIDESLEDGRLDDVSKAREKLGSIRGYRDKLMSVAETMDNSYNGPQRGSMSATDALSRIGGGFGNHFREGSSAEARVLMNGIEVQNSLLRDIRANTLKKGSTWL